MNYKKITFNKIVISIICITTMPLSASEHYNSSADAHTRRTLIHCALQQKNNTAHNLEDLNLRSTILDKNLTQVQALLTTYDRDVMCSKIVDDAQASLDETTLSSTIKKPASQIAHGAALTVGVGLILYNLHNENACAVALIGLGVGFYKFCNGISRIPSALQGYHEFCQKYSDEQQRAAAISCARQIREVINNYQSQKKD